MEKIKKALKEFVGASWNNPVINAFAVALNIPDKIVRRMRGLGHLPKYSGRIRSNGVLGQFGGKKFYYRGKLLGNILIQQCQLKPEHRAMEVGCGVGRTAVFLSEYLDDGNYFGWDVDKVSINIAQRLPLFKKKRFRFQHVNFLSNLYNKKGEQTPFRFPAEDNSFDVVFLVSVFTHMFPDDIAFYMKEISRVLKKDGRCMMTCFLMDYGAEKEPSFPYKKENYYINYQTKSLQLIAFERIFFENLFAQNSLVVEKILKGTWHGVTDFIPDTKIGQDIFILSSAK